MEIGQCEHLIERCDGPLQRRLVFLSGRLLITTDDRFGRNSPAEAATVRMVPPSAWTPALDFGTDIMAVHVICRAQGAGQG